MRIIKLAIISVVVFSLLITMISMFFPSRVRISRAIDINTDRKTIMLQLRDTANWMKWYPGADSALVLPRITAITDSSVSAETYMENGRKGVTGWNVYVAALPRTVTVQWYMDFRLRWYPWEKFSGLLLEKRYGPVMERGLERMKELIGQEIY